MYFDWQNDISRVLHQSPMFPKDSQFAKRAASTNNGFIALLALMTDTHPAFVDQPIMLAMNWPVQTGTESIFDFYTKFLDHIRLRAIFMGATDSMTSSTMVDCFINNCKHSSYLLHISRFDRQDPKKNGLFAPGALAITINNYLSNSDSPTKQLPRPPRPPEGPAIRKPFYPRRVNQMLTGIPNDDTPTDYTDLSDRVIAQMQAGHDPSTNPCILCRDGEIHRFKDCPLLQDDNFKTSFIIKMVTGVSKEIRQGKRNLQTANTKINQLLSDADTPDDSPADTAGAPDFPPGER
jgi:hypothetical protein